MRKYFDNIISMGLRWWIYRGTYALKKRSGLFRLKHYRKLNARALPDLDVWRKMPPVLFFKTKEETQFLREPVPELASAAAKIRMGKISFFNGIEADTGKDYDWITDPVSGYRYPLVHWSRIADLGEHDIKYVWEKSRFCYLYTILRYDHHFSADSSDFVYAEMLSWIAHNPPESGPNYISGQEIALRVLQWMCFLDFYRQSAALTSEMLHTILTSVHMQLLHVEHNIRFAERALQNNHLITEAAALYLLGSGLSFFPESARWAARGKRILEKAIPAQVFPDGTYLQYSMNYHRVMVQLITWVFLHAKSANISPDQGITDAGKRSLAFLMACMDRNSGKLPNYGSNDGSLFFPLNGNAYRDYRPQLQALSAVLGIPWYEKTIYEDCLWYGLQPTVEKKDAGKEIPLQSFKDSGYYLIRDADTLTMIRCGNHTRRPAQADNLHLDIWCGPENILRDGGTFSYNGDPSLMQFYFGSASHNTLMLGTLDQMLRGPHFTWYFWSRCTEALLSEKENTWIFSGTMKAFRHSGRWQRIRRTVQKTKHRKQWLVEDELLTTCTLPLVQVWNPSPVFNTGFTISACDAGGDALIPESKPAYYSETYGVQEMVTQIRFETLSGIIRTTIAQKNPAA